MADVAPEPLSSYLKAVGVLRLVAEQADPGAMGHWSGETFVLSTELPSDDALTDFFLNRYSPTPLVAHWNRRADLEDKRAGGKVLSTIKGSADPRLADYKVAIDAAEKVRTRAREAEWDSKRDKDKWLTASRAGFPIKVIAWLDAVAVMTGDGPKYPPLLGGTGGVLGSMDLSVNFMQRLPDLLCLDGSQESRARSGAWLRAALFDEGRPALTKDAIGQFDPGATGGPNSSPSGDGKSLTNPWNYVLLLEGALVFASAAARRMGTAGRGQGSIPFTVDASFVGFASGASAEDAKGEVWMPLWSRPATFGEIRYLIGEGRAEWRGSQARRGVDFARAVSSLGVDRGVEAFVRTLIVARRGKDNTAAIPVGRVSVAVKHDVPVVGQIDAWVEQLRRLDKPPATVQRALRHIDAATFEHAVRGGPARLQAVLGSLAAAESTVVTSSNLRDEIRPISGLSAHTWLPHLDDGTPDFRVAASLASLRDYGKIPALRMTLRAVAWSKKKMRLEWQDGGALVAGFLRRPLPDVLAAAHVRRAIEAVASTDRSIDEGTGIQTAFRYRLPAPAADVAEFADGALDDRRVADLLSGLLLLEWTEKVHIARPFSAADSLGPAPVAWRVLAPFFLGRPITGFGHEPIHIRPHASWPAKLAVGDVPTTVYEALRRLRIARLDPAPTSASAIARAAPRGPRLSAALLCPLTEFAVRGLLQSVCPKPLDERG